MNTEHQCKYDGKFCKKRQEICDDLIKSIKFLENPPVGRTGYSEAPDACPLSCDDKEKCERYIKAQQSKTSAVVCCPYDGNFCEDREVAFDAWKKHVEKCAREGIDYMFHTSPEQHCPESSHVQRVINCSRYRAYLAQQKHK